MEKEFTDKQHQAFAGYVRNFIFGVEDSLVSTVGLLSGIASAGIDKSTVALTGIILIFVEAFSMGVGSLLSEVSASEYLERKNLPLGHSLSNGAIMFVSYFIAGFIPLGPYLFLSSNYAFPVSILLSLISLFILGMVGGKLFNTHLLRHGLRMFMIGGIAIAIGVIVGSLVK